RIHWLRGRASAMRWAEEETLVGYEMQWTVRHFMHNGKKWRNELAGNPQLSAGGRAYAERKKAMWESMAAAADKEFCKINGDYVSVL
ncbi:hypothetical protein HYPSUDRAFT_152363, partial [Hypholoma sublateritium FD-334 SS-4]